MNKLLHSFNLSLQKKWLSPAIRGISYMSLFRYGTKVLAYARLVILARFFGEQGPFELGTFGLAILILAITEVFTQTGINIVLIKDRRLLEKYIDTAWIISIVRGLLIAAIIWLLSPWMVAFFHNPSLEIYLGWALLVPILRGLLNPAIITYQQKLEFGKESLFRTAIQLIDMISGLLLAIYLHSALGLLWGMLLGVLVELVMSFLLFKPWPRLSGWKWSLVPSLFSKTRYVIGNGIMTYLNENLDDLLIGRLLGTTGLGFYQMAYKLASAATIEVGNILRDTLYPLYALLVKRPQKLKGLVIKTQLWQSMFYGVIFIGAWFFAKPIILITLGQEWQPIVPALQILVVSGGLRGFYNAWYPVFLLSDTVHRSLIVNSLSTITMVISIWYLAPRYGLVGSSVAILLSMILTLPLMWWWRRQALEKLS